ncbi:hypothetical protein Pmani_029547 [Petrolisthes manimaculis]|uniref:Uncharacterized protein n=1 Tax=Petrolisthes manimaculis TaxID=1843537 RepID=A0AAE1TTR9_9EUCA|nr:hypothetical protein Pmani_029547 [Petrolisthes manimaculis]
MFKDRWINIKLPERPAQVRIFFVISNAILNFRGGGGGGGGGRRRVGDRGGVGDRIGDRGAGDRGGVGDRVGGRGGKGGGGGARAFGKEFILGEETPGL